MSASVPSAMPVGTFFNCVQSTGFVPVLIVPVALSEVEAAVLDRTAVARLIRTQPAVGAKLLVKITQLLAQRLRNTSNQVIRLLKEK